MKLKSNLNEKRNIYYVQEGKFVILSYYNKKQYNSQFVATCENAAKPGNTIAQQL